MLVGSTGASPVAASLTGTSNQITVTNGGGSITLSTPQDIATGSSPTFNGLTLSSETLNGKITTYNSVATAGLGVPGIYQAPAVSATKTANFTVFSYTPASSASTWRVQCVITTTSSTNTGTLQVTLDYKDSQGATHTADIIPLFGSAGTYGVTQTSVASKEFHTSSYLFTIDNTGTAIALKVVITGTVSYTVQGTLERVL